MTFRESYGLAPKHVTRCPVCGVEKKHPTPCRAHTPSAWRRRVNAWLRVFREAIDEARS